MFGLRHFLYADSMFALAHILKKMGGQEEASLKLMNDAIRILEEAGESSSWIHSTPQSVELWLLCREAHRQPMPSDSTAQEDTVGNCHLLVCRFML